MLYGCIMVGEFWYGGSQSSCVLWCGWLTWLDGRHGGCCSCVVGLCKTGCCLFAMCSIQGVCGGIS